MSSKNALKQRAFKRDGWQDEHGNWFADCAFGCGDILDHRHATLDRHPIMGQNGGKYTLDNVRLACAPCNSRNKNSVKQIEKKAKQKLKNVAINNAPRDRVTGPTYPQHTKKKIKENYPAAEGRDRNGIILMDLR